MNGSDSGLVLGATNAGLDLKATLSRAPEKDHERWARFIEASLVKPQ